MVRETRRVEQDRRRLAGDTRAGRWARGEARRRQRLFLRRNWPKVLLAGLLMIVPVSAASYAEPNGFASGLVLGAGLVAVIGLLTFTIVQVTGTASTMMGDLAEQWTAQELRKLPDGWRLVNHVSLRAWDIDHVLVGPGGVFAVETKWSATSWEDPFGKGRMVSAARQAAGNAHDLAIWSPMGPARRSVTPVVVLWGAGTRDADCATQEVDGVVVVNGRRCGEWRGRVATGRLLSTADVERAWEALAAHVRKRDATEEKVPPSLSRLAWTGVATAGAGIVGLLVATYAVRLPGHLWGAVVADVALLAVSWVRRAVGLLRFPVLGWRVGVAFGLVLIPAFLIAGS